METRPCPLCAETVLVAAIKCKHCGSAIAPVAATAPTRECPSCYRQISPGSVECPLCQSIIVWPSAAPAPAPIPTGNGEFVAAGILVECLAAINVGLVMVGSAVLAADQIPWSKRDSAIANILVWATIAGALIVSGIFTFIRRRWAVTLGSMFSSGAALQHGWNGYTNESAMSWLFSFVALASLTLCIICESTLKKRRPATDVRS